MTDIKEYLINFYIKQNGCIISPELAEMIVKDFAITDGDAKRTTGEKWTIEETTGVAESLGITFDKFSKWDWYVVLNNEYSDKYALVQKYNLPEPQVYFDFALSWFNDVDAKENKTFKYFFC